MQPVTADGQAAIAARERCAGFTLIEVLVATAVIAAGVSTAAGLAVVSGRANRLAEQRSMATRLARAKVEQVRSLAWTRDAAFATISDRSTDLASPPVEAGGAGLSPSPPGTLDQDVPGHCDYLDMNGQWVAEGAKSPQAFWVRRWSIRPLSPDLPDLLRIEVGVEPLQRVTRFARSAARPGEGARLVAIRTRTMR